MVMTKVLTRDRIVEELLDSKPTQGSKAVPVHGKGSAGSASGAVAGVALAGGLLALGASWLAGHPAGESAPDPVEEPEAEKLERATMYALENYPDTEALANERLD